MSGMYDIDRRLYEIAMRHRGVITRLAALAAGVSEHAIDDRVKAGVLIPLHDGVYRHAAAPYTQELRELAAVLACGSDAVLAARSAAALHGYPGARSVVPMVMTPHTDLPRIKGVKIMRAVRLRPFEVTVVRGIPVTAKGKTALDYCALTSFEVAQEVIAQALIRKVVRPEEILAALERSGGQGQRGTVKLRGIAESIDEIMELESVLELVVSRVLDDALVPRAERQYPLTCADGREVRLDFAWPAARLALEANGRRWHDTPARKKRTRERKASIEASDWHVIDCGWAEAHEAPADLRREVEDLYGYRIRRAA